MKLIGMNILKPLALASLAGLAAASSEELPHDHQGKLSKYELGPPKIFLSGDDLAHVQIQKVLSIVIMMVFAIY